MRLTEVTYPDGRPVDGYGPGFFRIGGAVVEGSALNLPGGAAPWAGYEDYDAILNAAADMDVLLVGTGAEIAHIPADFRQRVEDAGVGVEVMNSPTACRTFNVLLSEGRRIGLAVLAV